MSVMFCDSNCELWHTKIKELKLNVIGMPYTIEGEEYFYDNGEKTDFKAFYKKVGDGKMPVTSALNSTNYTEIFEPFFKKGEEILYVSFSDKLSATFEFMNTAVAELSKKYPKARFTRFDTKSISMGAGVQVFLAAKFFNEGHTIPETVEYLNTITKKISTFFTIDNLGHLKRGGRLSSSSAFFGSILQIKPILKIGDEGILSVFNKQMGFSKALQFLANSVIEKYAKLEGCPIVILDADAENASIKLEALIKKGLPKVEIWRQPIGPTVGTHCGPGACGVIFPSTQRW